MTRFSRAPIRDVFSLRRRGIAMMLVLIALAVGTVIGASVLTARQTAPHIAVNAAESVTADWAAQSAAESAVAVLQTSADWMSNGGVIMTNYPIGDALVDAVITNLQGQPPAAGERELLVTVTAKKGGMETTVVKKVSLAAQSTVGNAVDPYWGEFAILATSSLRLQNSAELRIDPWSPESTSAYPIKVGTSFVAAGSYSIAGDSKVPNCELYVDQKASALLRQRVTMSPWVGGAVLPLNLPIYHEKPPSGLASLLTLLFFNLSLDGLFDTTTLIGAGVFQAISIDNEAELTIDAALGSLYSLASLDARNNATLRIVGNVHLVLRGDSEFRDGAGIELATPASSLTIYTFGDLKIRNTGIGVAREIAADPARCPADLGTYHNPRRIRILSVSAAAGGDPGATFEIEDKSLVVASIHAPSHAVTVRNGSWLVGRLTGSVVDIDNSTIFYSPGLDPRNGFSVLSGPLYDSGGQPRPAVTNTIASANASLGAAAIAQLIIDAVIAEIAAEPVVILDPGDPTPRTGGQVIESTTPKTANELEAIY